MTPHSESIRLLRIAEVGDRVGLSRPVIYKMMSRGEFPRAVYPAPRAPRWRSDDVDAFIERVSATKDADFEKASQAARARLQSRHTDSADQVAA